ncbi:hypothetical protein BK010_06125 [Tenericutes bacterium MO-XQ]|nr:hypothetical protein BK010_06125 [Tenericutes bacterium MO-XQ]
MKKFIERYIYDVTRRLPKENQEEVKEELSDNIYDMLPEDPKEEDIDRVLHELGHPREIANNYKEQKRYLISPLYYDDYLRVLKIVFIIFGVISLVTTSIDAIIDVDHASIFEAMGYVISRIIGELVSTLFSMFAIVTIIFVLIERNSINIKPNEWKLKDLPDLPEPKKTNISKASAMVSLIFHVIFSVIFIIILLRYIPKIGWYNESGFVAPLFNEHVTDPFIIFFIISFIIGFIMHLVQLYVGQWQVKVAVCYTANAIISVTIGLLFINQPNLFSFAFLNELATVMEQDVSFVQDGLNNILVWITVIVIVVTGIDLISIWLKTLKPKETKKAV